MKSDNHSNQAEQQVPSMVPNTAAADRFIAPDSTAARPNPGSLADRPRRPNQTPASAVEADL